MPDITATFSFGEFPQLRVEVRQFGDSGWLVVQSEWRETLAGEADQLTLGGWLERTLRITPEEAEALVTRLEEEWLPIWRRRGGAAASATVQKIGRHGLMAVVALALLVTLGLAMIAYVASGGR